MGVWRGEMMRRKVTQVSAAQPRQFPPEAEADFDVVPEAEIAVWRERLNERYDIGKGKLRPVEEPKAPA